MSTKPMRTRYAQITHQNVLDIDEIRRERGRRIERGRHPDGRPYIKAIFPTPTGLKPEHVVDLSFLLTLPALAEPFVDAIFDYYGSKPRTPRTITEGILAFQRGFFAFAVESNLTHLTLSQLDTTCANSFIRWLNRANAGKERYAESTRARMLGIFKAVIATLRSSDRWNVQIQRTLYIHDNPWPGRSRRQKPVGIIDMSDFARIYQACVKEVIETKERLETGWRLMVAAKSRINNVPQSLYNYAEFDVRLATLADRFPNRIINLKHIRAIDDNLYNAILKSPGGLTELMQYLYPSPRHLIPFALLLAIHTLYNPETILASQVDDFKLTQSLGQPIILAMAYKGRSKRKQYTYIPADETPDNPATLIAFLTKWTASLRSIARPYYAKRLFLFVPATASRVAKGFGAASQSATSDITWSRGLRAFCREHGLRPFTLTQIRPTALDIVHSVENGDIRRVMAAANHRNANTTHSHYTSDAARQRNADRLAEVIEVRARWRETNGRIDPRGLPSDADIGSATPGWRCLDPYASPYSPPDKLCSAYGHCPACPLADLDISSPYACAQAHNLLDAVRKSAETMLPQAWLERIGPVHHALVHRWLPLFPVDIVERAKTLKLSLLPIPE